MSMPKATQRYHLEPYWLGDSPEAVKRCARMKPGPDHDQVIDLNLQACLDGIAVCHWGTPGKNGYHYIIVSPGHRRRLTPKELKRPLTEWHIADVRNMRRTAHVQKGKYASHVRIWEIGEMWRFCARVGVQPAGEMKTQRFSQPVWAARAVAAATAAGVKPWFMALWNMAKCGEKAKAVHEAGGEFAVLGHGRRSAPLWFNRYKPYITQVWNANWGGL